MNVKPKGTWNLLDLLGYQNIIDINSADNILGIPLAKMSTYLTITFIFQVKSIL